jgi:hypothetical protein
VEHQVKAGGVRSLEVTLIVRFAAEYSYLHSSILAIAIGQASLSLYANRS